MDTRILFEQSLPDKAWMSGGAREEALYPEMEIVDPHHHFSEHWGGYFGADLVADLECGHRVLATVYVQCGYGYDANANSVLAPVGETLAAIRLAKDVQNDSVRTKICAGIVGFANLADSRVKEVLEAHVQAGQGRFRGIRQSAARDDGFRYGVLPAPQAGLYLDQRFQRGLSQLKDHDLSFDALCYHPQLGELAHLAASVPSVQIAINHTGMPVGVGPYSGRSNEVFQDWHKGMKALAQLPNVYVKLGGLGTAVCGFNLRARERPASSREIAQLWRPYFETCIDLFGPERCMFESNFPVDKSIVGYTVLWNAYKQVVADASDTERTNLLRGTAIAFYKLPLLDFRN